MPLVCSYLSEAEINRIFDAVSLAELPDEEKQEMVDLAQGDMDTRLNPRFKTPLRAIGSDSLAGAPVNVQNKIKLTFKSSLRNILGQEYMRNSDLNNLGDYTSTQESILKNHVKDLLNHLNDFKLELQSYAQEAVEPVQAVGIARANNDMGMDYDD